MDISILGCGWLGFPLAERLITQGHRLKGSTTTPKKMRLLNQSGIEPFLIKLPEDADKTDHDSFYDADIFVFNTPPGRKNPNSGEDYLESLKTVLWKAEEHSLSWIIFTSSTSVYSQFGGITSEAQAKKGSASSKTGELLLDAEEMIRESGKDYTILRLGGLYGYGRHPIHYLSGKKDLGKGNKPVNLVHQLDCVNIITEVVRQKKRNEIYNVVSDGHPPRSEFYRSAADHFNLPKPQFKPDSKTNYRIVSNQKLKEDLYYRFKYPNPMDHTP
jgi:nucleoside-diphosphate-sugar epimerase